MENDNVNYFFIGMKFDSFETLKLQIANYEKHNFCNLKIRESRRILNAQRRLNRSVNAQLIYYEIKYVCFFGVSYKCNGKGDRKTSTLKSNCPFHIALRASTDGHFLEVKSMNLFHNHTLDASIYQNLPSQRKINRSDKVLSELISLGANKKLIQAKIHQETGRNVSLKSLHNITKYTSVEVNNVDSIVTLLQKNFNCKVKILSNKNSVCGIFFMDDKMKQAFDFFPEVVFMDATYKLLDSR